MQGLEKSFNISELSPTADCLSRVVTHQLQWLSVWLCGWGGFQWQTSVQLCWGWRVGGRASISMQLVVWTGLNSDPYGCGCVLVYAWSGIVRVWWAWIVTNTDKWFFSLHVLLQPGKYHCCKHSKSIRLSSMRLLFVSVCRSLSLSSGCWSQHCGRAMDLKRLYALDDFSAITGWAKAINPLHMFHLRPKKQNKLICPKLRGFHFISPTQSLQWM